MSEENEHREEKRRVRPRQSVMPRVFVEKAQRDFYSDEHPEVPKIRRASLKQTHIEVLPGSTEGLEADDTTITRRLRPDISARTTRKQPRPNPPEVIEIEEVELEVETQEMAREPRQPARPRRGEMLPFTGLDGVTLETERRPRVAPAGRPKERETSIHPVLHRPGNARRGEQSFWRRRKVWLLCGLLLVLLLIFIPLIQGLERNLTGQQPGSISISTGSSVPISRLQNVPANPRNLVIVPPKTDHPAPPIVAQEAYLLDTDSEATLYAQNAFTHLPMLSTTKLMTATLAVETGNLDQQITITEAMIHDISLLSADSALFGVKLGETYSLRDLLYGLLFVSGNDAALVIADALAGSVPDFVAEMNQKAQVLGLNDTHFVNPHGLLDPGQYSCARDLAVLGQYSLSIPALQQISGARTYHIAAGGKHGERVLLNENQFLWWFPGVTGGKTGFDGVSDFVQVMQVTRANHHLIGVVIHTNNWWTDMRDLMDYGFNSYTWISPRDVDASGQPIPYDNLWNYFANDTQDVSVSLAPDQRYYVFTGYTVSGVILTYFDKNGGLKKFGFPIKMPAPTNSNSMTQQFQHASIACNLLTNQCSTV